MAYNSAYTGPQVDAAVASVTQNADYWSAKQNAIMGDQSQVGGFAEDGTLVPVNLAAANVTFVPMESGGATDTQSAIEDVQRMVNSLPQGNVVASAFQTFYN